MNQIAEFVTQSWFWKYVFSQWGWVDWVLGVFLLVGVFLGLTGGLSQEIPKIFENLISIYVTLEFFPLPAAWLALKTPLPEAYAKVLSFGLVWAASWVVLRVLFRLVGGLARLEIAPPFQWVGGALLGAVRYFLFFSMISYFLVLFPLDWPKRSYQVQSWSGPVLVKIPAQIHAGVNRILFRRGGTPKRAV